MDGNQSADRFSLFELQNAFRNRGMPLEALCYDITPTALQYVAPGEHVLACRATDAADNTQPDQVWNVQGMGNNAVQRVPIVPRYRAVRPPAGIRRPEERDLRV